MGKSKDMSVTKYLAFDFGAESGRAIVGILDGERISVEEINRFKNNHIKVFHNYYWNTFELFEELKKGLKIAVQKGHGDIKSIGIDTWGVDFGILDNEGKLLELPHTYRDPRTEDMMEKVFNIIPREEIYARTGIQFMEINSLYQLFAIKKLKEQKLKKGKNLLFMPDLINYFLTGEINNEYTIASTSQFLNVHEKQFDKEIFTRLNLPYEILAPVIKPGHIIGKMLKEVSDETGIYADVIAVGCHDTASAVAAVPAEGENWAYISSGTWSLIGIETDKPIINQQFQNDFTNEGGVGDKICFLRNTMGMWLIQRLRKLWERDGGTFDYVDIANIASKADQFKCFINPDDRLFTNPENMEDAIDEFCKRTNQKCPKDKFEYARTIYESLALKYKLIIKMIEEASGKKIENLHIVGGGAQNEFLNQLTADATGIQVLAGPVEATALGSILVQAIAADKVKSIEHAREIIKSSFDIKVYSPRQTEKWDNILEKYKSIIV
jgi:rhamnulokinase